MHGAELVDGVWVLTAWDACGRFGHGLDKVGLDLVNVPEEKVRWVNVYSTHTGDLHATREYAIKVATGKRTGLLKLTFRDDKLVKAEVEDV